LGFFDFGSLIHRCQRIVARRLIPRSSISILFEQYLRERRMRVMRIFAENTFDVDSALKSWLEKAGPDRTRKSRRSELNG
jgi:hypothetical protein